MAYEHIIMMILAKQLLATKVRIELKKTHITSSGARNRIGRTCACTCCTSRPVPQMINNYVEHILCGAFSHSSAACKLCCTNARAMFMLTDFLWPFFIFGCERRDARCDWAAFDNILRAVRARGALPFWDIARVLLMYYKSNGWSNGFDRVFLCCVVWHRWRIAIYIGQRHAQVVHECGVGHQVGNKGVSEISFHMQTEIYIIKCIATVFQHDDIFSVHNVN